MKQHLGRRARSVQRPWGRAVTGSLVEERGALCGWSRVSEGEREERRAGRRWGRLCRTLWSTGRTWVFPSRELQALEVCREQGGAVVEV